MSEDRRAEIMARRARIQTETAALLPEQRLYRGQVFGELQRGRMVDLKEGALLEVVGRRWRYDRIIEAIGARARARTRLTVRFLAQGRKFEEGGFTVRWDTEVSYRLPVAQNGSVSGS